MASLCVYSCIFHPCNFARIAFLTPTFSVAPWQCTYCHKTTKTGSDSGWAHMQHRRLGTLTLALCRSVLAHRVVTGHYEGGDGGWLAAWMTSPVSADPVQLGNVFSILSANDRRSLCERGSVVSNKVVCRLIYMCGVRACCPSDKLDAETKPRRRCNRIKRKWREYCVLFSSRIAWEIQ